MITHLMGRTLLHVDHVGLVYGDKIVLRDVCADVKEIIREGSKGQVVGFLGPSGVGKTSLFRLIAGLEKPTEGQVSINGCDEPVRAGEVGVVGQGYPLFWHRTVMSNLMLAASMNSNGDKDGEEKVKGYLEEFGLSNRAHAYPVQLSGGQRQRVSIIQQILCSTNILLLDEPFSGLDLIAEEKVCKLIQKVANLDQANLVIVVTHDVTAAATVADHIWMLGRDRDEKDQIVPGARIQKIYDLVDMDLCWHEGIQNRADFTEFVRQMKQDFVRL